MNSDGAKSGFEFSDGSMYALSSFSSPSTVLLTLIVVSSYVVSVCVCVDEILRSFGTAFTTRKGVTAS